MDVLVMIGQLLLGLTILVGIHEWGHYIAARIFGIRVNKFYIFFDFLFPLPSVLNFALWKTKKGDTEYGLGWFPMGGYVDIEGMIDETKDASQLAEEPKPYEFRAKPAWQRLIVMLGGVIVNVIVGVLIFWLITYKNGETKLPMTEVNKRGIVAHDLAQSIGLETGDKIIDISGKPVEYFRDVFSGDVLLGENNYYTIERDGKKITRTIPNDLYNDFAEDENDGKFIDIITPFEVANVVADSPADSVGLEIGDRIIGFDGESINYYHEFVNKANENSGQQVNLDILRGKDTLSLFPVLTEDSKLGFNSKRLINYEKRELGVGEAFAMGSSRAFSVITDNIKGFKKIFSGQVEASKALAGPVGIARKFYGGVWDWSRFWAITGMLSMALAFMNLLPIPALDGGHALILLYEIVSGRKPSEKFMERTQQVGTVILLALLVLILFNDTLQAIF